MGLNLEADESASAGHGCWKLLLRENLLCPNSHLTPESFHPGCGKFEILTSLGKKVAGNCVSRKGGKGVQKAENEHCS